MTQAGKATFSSVLKTSSEDFRKDDDKSAAFSIVVESVCDRDDATAFS